jgi:membrane fusion protein (multidrug efflux system)
MSRRPLLILIALLIAALVWLLWPIGSAPESGSGGAGSGPPGMGGPPGAASPMGRGGPPGMGGGLPVAVVTQRVGEQALARELKSLGTAQARDAVEITAKVSNLVTALRFEDGQPVREGDVLVELDSAQVRADLAAAEAAYAESLSQFRRAEELLPTQVLSQAQFEQISATKLANAARVDASRARLEDTVIRAPFSGRVGLRRVSVGSLISPGTVITTLDDARLIKIDFGVPEANLTALRVDLPVAVASVAYPGRIFVGRVASIDSRIDPASRSVLVRAEVPNEEGLLKPGMFLNVSLERDARRAIVVPEEALVPEENRQYVYVVTEGVAVKRQVNIGARRPGVVEILSGLQAGERVVIEGTIKLREGGPVRDLAADASSGSGA